MSEPFINQDPLQPGISEENRSGDGVVLPPARPLFGKPFEKGKSGNPNGRPKSKILTNATHRVLSKKVPPEMLASLTSKAPDMLKVVGKRPTFADILAYSNVQQAIRGNSSIVAQIYNRVEGRIPKEITDADTGQLDELIAALALPPAKPGEVNE